MALPPTKKRVHLCEEHFQEGMHLRNASKILKVGPIRTSNDEMIKHITGISTWSNNISDDANNGFILNESKYKPNRIHKWQNKDVRFLKLHFYSTEELLDSNTFERVCEETLHSLAEYFDDIIASDSKLQKADVAYGVGVLTIDLGNYGTYVINRQSPNKQIWLSSPTSGPKRFDYVINRDCWIYKHDGQGLHSLLKQEFEHIIGKKLDISNCAHSNT